VSASVAHGSPVEVLVGDELVSFPRLNMRETGVFQDRIRAERVEAAKAASLEVIDKIAATERAGFILQASRQPVTAEDIDAELGHHSFARSVMEKSLAKTGKQASDATAIVDKIDMFTGSDLARQIVSLIVPVLTQGKVGKREDRDWLAERMLITEHFPNLGDPSELIEPQYEYALMVAKSRQQAKQNAPQG
jgi:hypothetical protein